MVEDATDDPIDMLLPPYPNEDKSAPPTIEVVPTGATYDVVVTGVT